MCIWIFDILAPKEDKFLIETLTLNPDSWKFIIASDMLTSSGKITFSALNGPAKRSDKVRIESEMNSCNKY